MGRIAIARRLAPLLVSLGLVWPGSGAAAVDPASMLARYQRAAEIQGADAHRWIRNASVEPHWIGRQDAFWYRRDTAAGHRFTRVYAPSGRRSDLFDHATLARALGAKVGRLLTPDGLPLIGLRVDARSGDIGFSAFGQGWRFTVGSALTAERPRGDLAISPDGRRAILSKGADLWTLDLVDGTTRALTSDGTPDLAYGAPLSPFTSEGAPPRVLWSPDSQRVLTVVRDERGVGDMPVIDWAPADGLRPRVVATRYALPGDKVIPSYRLVVIDVATGRQLPILFEPLPAVRMVDTPVDEGRAWWSADGKTVYFVAIARGEKDVRLVAADSATGTTRVLFSEASETSIELGPDIYSAPAIRLLPKSHQMIWYSERSGSAQLYLYDLDTGALIRPLTRGRGLVRDILGVDETRRQMFVSLAGRTPGRDPYDQDVARVDLDTGALITIAAGEGDHAVFVAGKGMQSTTQTLDLAAGAERAGFSGVSPSGRYVVETVFKADGPSRTLLRDRDGRQVRILETADASSAPAWWRWPEPVRLLAADGRTEISALVFRPSDFDPARSYPVIDVVYGGPQETAVPRGYGQDFFRDGSFFLDPASLAELGFVAVVIDGRGSGKRDRAFRIASYGRMETASDPADHLAAIHQLAAKHPYIDVDRIGITGFSGGGYLAASAMLRYPDAFKVGVAADGNQDQRLLVHAWGERYQGYPADAGYADQANAAHAAKLKGKLLLIHGLLDSGVNPAQTLQLAQALIDAGKTFDMLLLPRGQHQLPGYGTRRTWDYFVQHLAGEAPPADFPLRSYGDYRSEQMSQMLAAAPGAGP